jgi:threonine/homoserine/homoserine lactone efflux protein
MDCANCADRRKKATTCGAKQAINCDMMLETFAALALFSLVTSITPGPNNLMLLASGANFGFRPSIPHMLGISLGHGFMVFLVGVGLIGLFEAYPVSHTILKVASIGYMSWLAWKIAHAAPAGVGRPPRAPVHVSCRPRPFSGSTPRPGPWR